MKSEGLEDMATSRREQNWVNNYGLLRDFVRQYHHLPDKRRVENRGLLNWWKYNRKLVRQGKLDAERMRMLDELSRMRSV